MTASFTASAPATVRIGYVSGRLRVEPSTVHITVGQGVNWVFTADKAVGFEIDLHSSPFEDSSFREEVLMAQKTAAIETGPAMRPGDYKYDVKVRGPGGERLADDDPYIIVRPRGS